MVDIIIKKGRKITYSEIDNSNAHESKARHKFGDDRECEKHFRHLINEFPAGSPERRNAYEKFWKRPK